jgi:hypothetical protein
MVALRGGIDWRGVERHGWSVVVMEEKEGS